MTETGREMVEQYAVQVQWDARLNSRMAHDAPTTADRRRYSALAQEDAALARALVFALIHQERGHVE
jgi:hypothetical protein